uniref:Matrin-type domain-containing protein n=1 Tax=Amphiprion percula TaxID=161767 RepID=A0A3P8T000_AMPPE
MYEILDSVEDEAAVDEPTVSTRSTRGRSQRTSRKEASNPTKDDTRRRRTPARDSQKPNEEKAAAKERTPMKKSGAGEEEATYETLDSVEDDQPLTGGKPRRGRPKKDVKTAKKPNKAAKEEEEEEATYQVLDSVGDETVEDQHHTEESKSPRKSTVCEDDSRNTKKSVEFVVPKSGFFCELCSVFYLNEISAKETHCSSQRHYHNLERNREEKKQS